MTAEPFTCSFGLKTIEETTHGGQDGLLLQGYATRFGEVDQSGVIAAATHNVAGQLVFGVLCVCGLFAYLFGLWGYSAMGLRSYAPVAVIAAALLGLALAGLGPF